MIESTESIIQRITAEVRREFGPGLLAGATCQPELALISAACVGYRMALVDQRNEMFGRLADATRGLERKATGMIDRALLVTA